MPRCSRATRAPPAGADTVSADRLRARREPLGLPGPTLRDPGARYLMAGMLIEWRME